MSQKSPGDYLRRVEKIRAKKAADRNKPKDTKGTDYERTVEKKRINKKVPENARTIREANQTSEALKLEVIKNKHAGKFKDTCQTLTNDLSAIGSAILRRVGLQKELQEGIRTNTTYPKSINLALQSLTGVSVYELTKDLSTTYASVKAMFASISHTCTDEQIKTFNNAHKRLSENLQQQIISKFVLNYAYNVSAVAMSGIWKEFPQLSSDQRRQFNLNNKLVIAGILVAKPELGLSAELKRKFGISNITPSQLRTMLQAYIKNGNGGKAGVDLFEFSFKHAPKKDFVNFVLGGKYIHSFVESLARKQTTPQRSYGQPSVQQRNNNENWVNDAGNAAGAFEFLRQLGNMLKGGGFSPSF
jgi:hypothetical protein